jgi:hypothetical protein
MTFIHGYLLGGLLLAGVPVLLHLIMRPKPRRLRFPAFRFLRQRHRINQRKLRLQHLLLLLLRIAVIAALCLALARPRVVTGRFNFGNERPVVAVLVIDTSASMGYAVAGQTRLDEAKRRARELFDEMDKDSRVAVLDSADDGSDNFLPHAEALMRLDTLAIRFGNAPLNPALGRAVRLLEKAGEGEDPPPRFLYLFSDRTRACWDPAARKPAIPDGVAALFVDVGVETPRDQAIDKVEIDPPVVAPGAKYEVRVTLRGTGPGGRENELSVSLDNDPDPERKPDRRPVRLGDGPTSELIVFERVAPTPADEGTADAPYQVTVKLGARDALPFNNTRYATIVVRRPRKVLLIVDAGRQATAKGWLDVTESKGNFRCEVKTVVQAEKLDAKALAAYKVACLFQVVRPPDSLWKKLTGFVRDGGGLMIVPGGEEMTSDDVEAYNAHAGGTLPAKWDRLREAPDDKGVAWSRFRGEHPLLAPFLKDIRTADPDYNRPEQRPLVHRYWEVTPQGKDAQPILAYAGATKRPVLVEKPLGRGRVLQFTTPLDDRQLIPNDNRSPYLHNYYESSFGVVLADRVALYLAGETTVPELNYICGQVPLVTLPGPPAGPYTVRGPGLAASEQDLKPPGAEAELPRAGVPQAQAPGHYGVYNGRGELVATFSLNVRPEENILERVPAEEIETALGPRSLLQVGRSVGLNEALQTTRPPPMELLPYLMMALLLVLTLESLLANRFYRRPAPVPGEGEGGQSTEDGEKEPAGAQP